MSRSTQLIGLNYRAKNWLENNKLIKEGSALCPHCYKSLDKKCSEVKEFIDNDEGMFGESIAMYKYKLKDGRYATEFVQDAPWFGGPVIFLALKIDNIKIEESLWDKEEIRYYV